MSWHTQYLLAEYEDGARGPHKFDCWGLVREVRHVHCGKRLLPSWGHLRNTQPKEFTQAYREESGRMDECLPEPGAVAAVFRGLICIHVAVVVDLGEGLRVLEINPKRGARLMRVSDFEAQYLKVRYYRDR
jgi:hypothetical protein